MSARMTYWIGKRIGDPDCPVAVIERAPDYDCGPLWGKGAILIERKGKAHGVRARQGWVPQSWVRE